MKDICMNVLNLSKDIATIFGTHMACKAAYAFASIGEKKDWQSFLDNKELAVSFLVSIMGSSRHKSIQHTLAYM